MIACHRQVSFGKQGFGQFQRIASVGARPVNLRLGHSLQNGVIVGLPLRKKCLIGFEEKIGLIANGKTIKRIRIVSRDIAGQTRRIGWIAIFQAERINHLHSGRPGEIEKLINVLFLRDRDTRIIHCIGANTQTFNAEGLEGC